MIEVDLQPDKQLVKLYVLQVDMDFCECRQVVHFKYHMSRL